MLGFREAIAGNSLILTEGAVIERLRREYTVGLNDFVANAAFIYDADKKKILEGLFRQYIDIIRPTGLPMINFTPTWRASAGRLVAAGLSERDVNGDNVRFLAGIRAQYGDYAKKIYLAGLLGCRGDAYNHADALSTDEAVAFHQYQVELLSKAGVDFLFAATMPALTEALGLAKLMSETGKPYIISFVIRPDGALLDGTPLEGAVMQIDSAVKEQPVGYMVNCVHSSTLKKALGSVSGLVKDRIIGIQANTSAKSPEELDNSTELDSESPQMFARGLLELHKEFGIRILGGCCGSTHQHIQALVNMVES